MDVLAELIRRTTRIFSRGDTTSLQAAQVLPGLKVALRPRTTSFEASLYEPVVCLILQGRKEMTIGSRTFQLSAGECMLVSHELSVMSRVTKAPYLVMLIDVDVPLLRSLYDEVQGAAPDVEHPRSLEVQRVDGAILETIGRYMSLAQSSVDARVLGPLVAKELHYRLLMAPLGGMLRRLLRYDSHESAIARAIAQIRREFREPIEVSALARNVGMSVSSFHKHFKDVTASTPLQFQKELRMLAARQLLVTGAANVSSAAFEVGYQSPNQFSRDYKRKFGAPPSRDEASSQSGV